MKLKYGMNPNQAYAEFLDDSNLQLLNGNASYINFLDALNAWQLVKEMRIATGLPSAASFKHVTPSGASVSNPFERNELESYNCNRPVTSALASAYLKARGSDRLASYGDFVATSETVDVETAKVIRGEVSDGIIAPEYTPEALRVLKRKKRGEYPIFLINRDYEPESVEARQLYGFTLKQTRNDITVSPERLTNLRTGCSALPASVIQTLLVGLITLKYTQSNSIVVSYNGHAVGIGAGQQSRILCSELALSKANRWYQKTLLDYSAVEYPPKALTRTERDLIHEKARERMYGNKISVNELENLCMCSDAYFPQTDNIELAHKYGVRYIAAPSGSIMDGEVIQTCRDLGIVFVDTGIRLFHH